MTEGSRGCKKNVGGLENLRTLAAHSQGLGSVLSTDMVLTTFCNSSPSGCDFLFWLPWTPGTQMAHRRIHGQAICLDT